MMYMHMGEYPLGQMLQTMLGCIKILPGFLVAQESHRKDP